MRWWLIDCGEQQQQLEKQQLKKQSNFVVWWRRTTEKTSCDKRLFPLRVVDGAIRQLIIKPKRMKSSKVVLSSTSRGNEGGQSSDVLRTCIPIEWHHATNPSNTECPPFGSILCRCVLADFKICPSSLHLPLFPSH